MKKVVSLVATLLLSTFIALAAGDLSSLWNKANNLYTQKQYDSAVVIYEQIAAGKPQNPELYYNLGNTYYRLNKVPKSILNYERCLRLSPDYKAAKENLLLAQARMPAQMGQSKDIFFVKWWIGIVDQGKANTWATLALISFCVIFIIMILRRWKPATTAMLPLQLVGVLWICCVSFLTLGYFSAQNRVRSDSAVVMINETSLMNDSRKGKAVALVPEGAKVKILTESDGWLEVRLSDGRTGWMVLSAVEKI